MSEFTPPVTRKERERAEQVSLVVKAITQPVIEGTDLAQQQFLHVTDRTHGWTSEGEYV